MGTEQAEVVNWGAVRDKFPALASTTFLNSATMGQMPRAATAAVVAHFERRDGNAAVDAPTWFDDLDRLRGKLGRLVGATASDIAFIPSTAHGLSIVLNGIDWKAGDRIVTLDPEFPNNTYAPSLLTRMGVEFVEAPVAEFAGAVNERTRLVIVSALSYVTGMRAPIAELRRLAPNALLYVDGTQGCGAVAFDVEAQGIDVLAVHGYKWMLSPTGAGFMFVRPSVRKWLEPNVIGWRSHHSWRDWANLHHGAPEFSTAAEKYEGYFPALPLYYAMEQSVDLFLELGTGVIESRVLELAALLRGKVEELGGMVAHLDSPIVCCKFAGVESNTIAAKLMERNIIVSARHGWLRVSVHIYNNELDLEGFGTAVGELL